MSQYRKNIIGLIKRFIGNTPKTKSYSFSSPPGTSGVFYIGGFYDFSAIDSNLSQASATQAFGNANEAKGAHAFVVAGGAGTTDGSDLVLTVSGTSITDAGVRTATDTEVIVADATAASTDQYFETTKKWLGAIVFTLTSTAGTTFSFDFNYGFAKYEDFGNRNHTVTDFEVVGLAGANDSGFNVELLAHTSSGWTYAATGFVAGDGCLVDMNTDYLTETNLISGEQFAYKRSGLSQFVQGSDSEGCVVRVVTGANSSVRIMDCHLTVLLEQ